MCTGLHVKYPLFLSDFNEMNFLDRFSKSPHISNFMKVRPVVAAMFHKDGHDEANSHFSQFCERG